MKKIDLSKVKTSILSLFNGDEQAMRKFKFGVNYDMDKKILLHTHDLVGERISDYHLSKFKNIGEILAEFSELNYAPKFLGLPISELSLSSKIPSNINIINYSKRKWSDDNKKDFIGKIIRQIKQ